MVLSGQAQVVLKLKTCLKKQLSVLTLTIHSPKEKLIFARILMVGDKCLLNVLNLDNLQYSCYTGSTVTLLKQVTDRILSSILLSKLSPHVEEIIGIVSVGFNTTNQLLIRFFAVPAICFPSGFLHHLFSDPEGRGDNFLRCWLTLNRLHDVTSQELPLYDLKSCM